MTNEVEKDRCREGGGEVPQQRSKGRRKAFKTFAGIYRPCLGLKTKHFVKTNPKRSFSFQSLIRDISKSLFQTRNNSTELRCTLLNIVLRSFTRYNFIYNWANSFILSTISMVMRYYTRRCGPGISQCHRRAGLTVENIIIYCFRSLFGGIFSQKIIPRGKDRGVWHPSGILTFNHDYPQSVPTWQGGQRNYDPS